MGTYVGAVVVDFYYSDIPENLQIFTQNVKCLEVD